MKNLIILPDGSEISSGTEGAAILSVEREEAVNSGVLLMPGAVCAGMVQLKILDADEGLIRAGDTLKLYTVEDDLRTLAGTFIAQQPALNGKILTVTAYDRLTLLDKDLTHWLGGLDGWPYSLWELADLTCTQCGLTFSQQEIPNGAFAAMPFSFDGVTGRQIMSWIAQATGCFCVVTPEGEPEFRWYEESYLTITSGGTPEMWCGEGGVLRLQLRSTADETDGEMILCSNAVQVVRSDDDEMALQVQGGGPGHYQGGLSMQDFETPPIDGICIRQCAEDVGTVFPPEAKNRLFITGNPLLGAQGAYTLLPVAQVLFEKFSGISYTPCTVCLPDTVPVKVGSVLSVGEKKVYVMQLRRAEGGLTITCTGEKDPEGADVRNERTYTGLSGKVLKLRTDVEGLTAEHNDSKGKIARLQLDAEGIRGQVEANTGSGQVLQQQMSMLEQTADAIKLSVEKIRTDGAEKIRTTMGYTFDDSGLQISREGQQMKNLLDNTGMYVTRSGQTVLQANDTGVTAVDVKVGNFLIVGDHARFEDYGAGRTACYWLEG